MLYRRSVKKFIIDEGVLTEISLNESSYSESEYFFENEGNKEGKVDILCGNVKDVDKVDEIEQKDEFMAWDHDAAELMPHIFEEYWKFTHILDIYWPVNYLLAKAALSNVHAWCFDALEVKFESLKHSVSDLV